MATAENAVNCFNIGDVADTYSGTVEIENIYENVYKPRANEAKRAGEMENIMYTWMVKGKAAADRLKKAWQNKGRPKHVKVHGRWVLVMTDDAAPTEMTLRRFVACLAYDNALRGNGSPMLDKPAGAAQSSGNVQRFATAMSTMIDWDKISVTVSNPTLKVMVTSNLPALFTPGLHFVYRIWMKEANGIQKREIATAMMIAANCADLCRHSVKIRKYNPLLRVTIAHTLMISKNERGTAASLVTNAAGRQVEDEENFKDLLIKADLKAFAASGVYCIQSTKGKEAVRSIIAEMMEDKDVDAASLEEMLIALKDAED